jgi:MFS transporter, FHS family, glucose/mannose:H+ symporter
VTSTPLVSDPSSTKTRVSILDALVHIAFVLTGVVTTFLGPLLPALALRWRLADVQTGSFFTAQFMGSIVGAGLTGLILPRRGFRITLALGYLLMAAGTRGLLAVHWRMALISAVTYGIGLGLAIPASNLLVSAKNPGRRAAAVSILNFCWGLGAVAAPLMIAAAEQRGMLWNSLEALALVLLLMAVVMAIAPAGGIARPSSLARTPWRNAGWKFMVAVGAMFFLYVGIENSLAGWIATLMKRLPVGLAPDWLPAPTVFWAGLVAGRGIAPLLLRRFSERSTAVVGLAATVLATALLTVTSSRQWVLGAMLAAGLGLAAVFPITVALLSRFGEMEQRIAGVMFALAGLGGATVPWSVGLMSTAYGSLQAALAIPLLAGVVLLALHGVSDSRKGAL